MHSERMALEQPVVDWWTPDLHERRVSSPLFNGHDLRHQWIQGEVLSSFHLGILSAPCLACGNGRWPWRKNAPGRRVDNLFLNCAWADSIRRSMNPGYRIPRQRRRPDLPVHEPHQVTLWFDLRSSSVAETLGIRVHQKHGGQ